MAALHPSMPRKACQSNSSISAVLGYKHEESCCWCVQGRSIYRVHRGGPN